MANFNTIEVKDASGVPLNGQMLVDGRQINTFRKPPEVTAAIIYNMVNLPIRDDDVMFCSTPKSGTEPSQWAFGAKRTSYRRRSDVITSHRR